ncbi:MAG: ATP-binding protein [Planctomycetota bacterium]
MAKTATPEPIRRVAVTGGPAAGKTAILDVLRRHLDERVVVLPEAATTLFAGGFPRPRDPRGIRLLQKTIYDIQHSLEEIFAIEHPTVPHICDRGALDGAAYWPGGLDRFLGAMGTTIESEYARYEAVLFLETSAYVKGAYAVDNRFRIESPSQARRVDQKLQKIWSGHANYHQIGHETNFYEKVAVVLIKLHEILGVNHDTTPESGPARPAKKRAKKRTRKTP